MAHASTRTESEHGVLLSAFFRHCVLDHIQYYGTQHPYRMVVGRAELDTIPYLGTRGGSFMLAVVCWTILQAVIDAMAISFTALYH